MSVEAKIRKLLESTETEQVTEEAQENLAASGVADTGSKASSNMKKDTSKSAAVKTAGDSTQPMQGSSEKASFDTMDEDESNLGSKSSSSVSKDTTLPKSKGDAKSVKTQAMEETESEEAEVISEVDVRNELASIFGDDLSEEFKEKATSIFEAAVIARVNSEMDRIVEKLEEQNSAQLNEYKEAMVEKIDSYLNYIVEQWMDENQLAVENGLRNEITEQFIGGLKTLFQESYIEIPEDKVNVLDDLSEKVDSLTEKLDEAVNDNIELSKQYIELKKQIIFEEVVGGLASTEVEKMSTLVEGIDYSSEELYKEKLVVIKENYFPKEAKKSPEETLVEDSVSQPNFQNDDVMSKYIQAISRSIKAR